MAISVYQIRNKINDKSYIGISVDVEKRWKDHKSWAGRPVIQSAIRKYGESFFDFSVLEETETWGQACEKEKQYISNFKTKAPYGYNLTDGGDGFLGGKAWNKGLPMSDEVKKKLSKAVKKYHQNNENSFKGKVHSAESKARISESCKEAMTEERRKKISEGQKGRKLSKETIAKMSNKIPWNKGIPMADKSKKILSDACKGKNMGKQNPFYGQKHTDETKKKIAAIHKGNSYNLGRKFSEEHKRKLSAAKMGNKNRLGGNKHLENNIKTTSIKEGEC